MFVKSRTPISKSPHSYSAKIPWGVNSGRRSGKVRLLIGQERLLQADGLARPMSVVAQSALLLKL